MRNEKESIDVDDLFKEKALRLWNEKHEYYFAKDTLFFYNTRQNLWLLNSF